MSFDWMVWYGRVFDGMIGDGMEWDDFSIGWYGMGGL